MNKYKLLIITILAIMSSNGGQTINPICHKSNFITKLDFITATIYAATTNFIIAAKMFMDVENSYRKFLKDSRNNHMHAKNGNRKVPRIKNHICIGQLNKGNSNFGTYKELIINTIDTNNFDLFF